MNKKILVVDDDVDILDGISLVLQTEGYTVQTTSHADEAISIVHNFNPDLIILDVLMSGNDGRIICTNIKGSKKIQYIPVLMISADPTVKVSSYSSGANAFLAKPFDIDDLITIVKKYTNSYS